MIRSTNRTARRRRGFTLVEVMIAGTALTFVMGGVLMMSKQGSAAWRMNMALGTLDTKTERALDKVIRHVESASADNLLPDLEVTPCSDWIDFQEISGYSAGAVFLTATRRLELELEPGEVDNGLDDNNNGLIDEQRVVLVDNPGEADEQRITIARGVCEYLEGELPNGNDDNGNGLDDEPGLCFDMQGNLLNVRISMQKIGPDGQLMTRTLESSVTLLN